MSKIHGFSVSFSQDILNDRIVETCHFDARRRTYVKTRLPCVLVDVQTPTRRPTARLSTIGQGGTHFATRASDCGNSLRDVLNEENDATIEGDPNSKVTLFQAEELERRSAVCQILTGFKAFLKFAGAAKFSEIPANRYDDLDKMLSRKERAGR